MAEKPPETKIALEQVEGGVMLPVHAQPCARKCAIAGVHSGRLKVAVTQSAEKGKANAALVKLLEQLLDLKLSQIELRSGMSSSQKKFLVTGVRIVELRTRIEAQLMRASV